MKCIYKTTKTAQFIAALLFTALFTTISINAQSTIIKLPTTNSTSDFKITDNSLTPITLFQISADGSLLCSEPYASGSTAPSLGTGTRLWWFPQKAAFRVGYVTNTQWDGTSVGNYSFATGYNTIASGNSSTAMGYLTTASGDYSTARGRQTTASGTSSAAIGHLTTASANYSTALGYNTTASGVYSTAMGGGNTASGAYSTAMGISTTASGNFSTALGSSVSTNSMEGSFIIGDYSNLTTMSATANNQMMMRFAGGYVLYTNSATSIGATLAAGANSWGTTSDSTKKYAFLPVDGESVLNKISKFNLRSWSYNGQDSTKFRHYGPMAQEFYNSFGTDKYGVAGNDTTINQADFEGINLIAIQALAKRTNELKNVQKELKNKAKEIVLLNQKIEEQQNRFAIQQKQIAVQQRQINELNIMRTEFISFKKSMSVFLERGNKTNNTKVALK